MMLFHKGKIPAFDRGLLVASLLLICLGIMVISSASVMESMVKYGDSLYQTKKHVFAVLMALFVGMLCAMTPTEIWKKYSLHCFIVVCALMILVMIVGREINGAKRWLPLGFINLQPSELLKIFWILYFSSYVSRKIESISTTTKGFIKPAAFIGVMAVLLLVQHDMGSLVVVSCITYSLTFIAGAGFIKYGVVIMLALMLAFLLVLVSPYRIARFKSFMDPWQDQYGSGYQLTQSLMAFGRGGITGEGLGNSYQKLGYLPEAHTDFITSILGEEFGFVGMVLLLLLELFIVYKSFRLAFKILKQDAIYQGYVAAGIGTLFCVQTFINVGSASGGIPTKGLTLPLVSYGGSSMISCCMAIAILLRIDFEWRNNAISDKRKNES